MHTNVLPQPLLQAVLDLAALLVGTTVLLWFLLVHVCVLH